ncbi:MAG: hypothetical protein IMY87_04125 [Chloroflexi bacterium]|nr:hypothetical protein [Chloroflexota bacterium]
MSKVGRWVGQHESKRKPQPYLLSSRACFFQENASPFVPQFEPGTVVTVGRQYADYIVTEYGIAKLMNKNLRERANELISVAHPNFRAELRKEAQRLFWP